MKYLYLILLTLFAGTLFSQAPALIPYQAVARDASGQPLANTSLSARFTLHENTATGASVWQELQTVSTSALGLFTAQLGSVSPLTSVNWGSGAKFMQVEINAGNGFVDMGTTQLLSVPYALHSSEAQNAQNAQNAVNSQNAQIAQTAQNSGNGYSHVSATGDTLYFQNGSFVIIPGISLANGGSIVGCTNPTACNYNAAATQDNGSCVYPGCNDALACNYAANAGCDDGSCYYAGSACNDNNAATFNDVFNAFCVCEGSTGGSGNGAVLLPGNATCENEYISVTGCEGQTSINYDGRVYDLVEIGGQCWFAENLATDQYRNGDAIPTGLSDTVWYNTINTQQGAYAIYNDDANNDSIYGKLYNFYAVSDPRGLCPVGWHVPTDCDWMYLEGSLGMSVSEQESYGPRGTDESGQMKSTGTIEAGTGLWYSPNAGATNSSGFSGLPGGYRDAGGDDYLVGGGGYWWSSTQFGSRHAWYRSLYNNSTIVYRSASNTQDGFSVRCLRD